MTSRVLGLLAGFAVSGVPMAAFAATAQESGYVLDYDLNVKTATTGGFSSNGVPYATDNSGSIAAGSFTRVAYEMTLSGSTNPNSPNGTVWVSFDAPSSSANKLGVPTTTSGEVYKTPVSNMNVIAGATGTGVNNGGVTTQMGLTNGNIQFWPSDYGTNPKTSQYDWNNPSGNGGQGYGAMDISQITSPDGSTGNMFISFNDWSSNNNFDAGLGNNTGVDGVDGRANPNYTFRGNIGDYSSAELSVWVNAPEPASLGLMGVGALGLLARRRRA